MRKSQFIAAAAALLALTACTDDNLVVTGDELAQLDAAESSAIQFGTYMGQSVQTHGGEPGAINTGVLKGFGTGSYVENDAKKFGFGVFAYFTGTGTYNDQNGASPTLKANFMFNQKVWYDNTAATVTKWDYAPLKFWPNEVQNGGVDDQDNDTSGDPATSTGTKGGNLTFFAYAPYVALPISDESKGIVAINGKNAISDATPSNNSQELQGDPTVTYIIPSSSSDIVDLLWGTYGSTTSNVNGTGNLGATSTASTYVTTPVTSRASYEEDILRGYTTNADLTKQKTNGKVDFAFKHALAKVGGYAAETTSGSSSVNSGLMVILDVDDQKGGETGGSVGTVNISSTDYNATKVTIKSINISARSLVDASGDKKYLKESPKGVFNLATGKWTIDTAAGTSEEQTDATATTYAVSSLNSTLAEGTGFGTAWNSAVEGVVTTKAKNVFASEAAPLVFIPGTYPELTITVDYFVRTYDPSLPAVSDEGTWTKVEQIITKKVTFTNPVELNKQYGLLMHLGLNSVKFDATVSDWDTYGKVTDATVEEEKVEEIYLPINVGAIQFPAESKTVNIEVDGSTTKDAITITGLSASTEYTVSTSGTVTGDAGFPTTFTTGASETSKTWNLTLAPNTGAKDVTRTIPVTAGSVTLTINIKQKPQPLVATLESQFSGEITKEGITTATALLTSLKTAGGTNVSSYTLTSDAEWATVEDNTKLKIDARTEGNDPRTATITIKATGTDETATTTVTITQAKYE